MKKILFLLSLLTVSLFAMSQGAPFPNYQPQGSPTTRWTQQGAVQGIKGLINGVYTDTATANLGYIDFYPGAQIFCTNDKTIWVRDSPAVRWIKQSTSITTFEFNTDSTVIICFGTNVCDTLQISNTFITNIVNNNFTDITNYGDTALIVCTGTGAAMVCDTFYFNLDSINNYYFINDTMLVACDTPQVIQIGDSSIIQQVCDTIKVPRRVLYRFQNGVQEIAPGIVEHGHSLPEPNPSQLYKDTYLYTDFFNYNVVGAPYERPTFRVQNKQWSSISSSVASFNHLGGNIYQFPSVDNENPVNMYLNYINRIIEGNGVFTGDTITQMYDRVGYAWMTNSQGIRAGYRVNSASAKQVGILWHTFDTENTDAITIFGNQTPNAYLFSVSPFPTTTLLNSRIAAFKTDKNLQFFGYPTTRHDGPPNNVLYTDADGNVLVDTLQGGSVTIINDTTIIICSFGSYLCDTLIIGGGIAAANNGASVSGDNVQLGQDVAAVGNPAILLNHREIPMGGFTISLNASATQASNIFQTKNSAAAIRARITAAASFSNTGGHGGSEIFGDGASVSGQNSVVIGFNASGPVQSVVIGEGASDISAGSDVIIGKSATSAAANPGTVMIGSGTSSTGSGGNNVIIGTASTSTSAGAVSVGYASVNGGTNSVGVGNQVIVGSGHEYSQAYGALTTTTAANQLVFGSSNAIAGGINDAYIGRGVTSTVNGDLALQTTGGSGSNRAGGVFSINGAKATGNAIGGPVKTRTSVPGSSGSTLQSLGDRQSITANYTTLTESSATSFVRINVPTGTVAGGEITWTVEANDGTDFQSLSGTTIWDGVNKAGTTTIQITTTPNTNAAVSSGTLTVTVTATDAGSGNIDFKINAVSSLTQTTLRAQTQVRKNFGVGDITAQ